MTRTQNTDPAELRQYLCAVCDHTGWLLTNDSGDKLVVTNGLRDPVTDELLTYTGVQMCRCLKKIRQGNYSTIIPIN